MIYGRCKMLKDWNSWDNEIHADEAQIVRQGRAMTYGFTFKVDKAKQTATFSSTSDLPYYTTSLSQCNCYDFQERGLPCKHIYRLAVELGYIEIIKRPTFDKDKLSEVKASDDIDKHPEQIKRQERAMDKKCTPTSIDYENGVGIFSGSGKTPYTATIDTCTCRDYFVRKLPCKHIYRLRYELKQSNGINPANRMTEENEKSIEYEKMTLDEFIDEEQNKDISDTGDNFGCCSKYKQCSLEGKCVQAGDYYKNCSYRKNLEQGKVFYSKRSPKFNQDKYDYIDNWFKALPNDKQEAFGEIVPAFVNLRRGATRVLCGSLSDLPDVINANNFKLVYDCIDGCDIFSAASPEELVGFLLSNETLSFYSFDYFNAKYSESNFKTSSIKFPIDLEYADSDYFNDDKTDANLTEEGKAKKKKRKEYQKKCWKEYLINDNPGVLNKFTECFAYISISPNFLFELDEWASDNWKLLPLKLDDFKFLFVERKTKDNAEDKRISFDFKKMKSVDWKNK